MKTILFDLDGTLIDHFSAIHRGLVHTQKQLGLPESDYDTVRATVGGSIVVTIGRLMGEQHVAEAVPLFSKYFETIMLEDVEILPGVEWLLSNLKASGEYKLGVFTNKYGPHARALLNHLNLAQYFNAIVGTGDTPHRKPDPIFTAHILEVMGAASDETTLVGDSPFDYAAAEVGCLKSFLVATGSHDEAQLAEETAADGIYSNMYQLGEVVYNLEPQLKS